MTSAIKSKDLAVQIRASEKTREAVETTLTTDDRVLARITDGIYRQPSSALRELISNAYDADATEVVILTDAPRFSEISVRDDGAGLSPETLEHLIKHIGGSAKRSETGELLGITSKKDSGYSPNGRKLIGKLGIGLFSVSQFTRHFLIITKTAGDPYRTVADITLGAVSGKQHETKNADRIEIETGSARIWREKASNDAAHGTEIKLLNLLPRTRTELASDDLWTKIKYDRDNDEPKPTRRPDWHIGRMMPKQESLMEVPPELPWNTEDEPKVRFEKLICAVRGAAESGTDSVDLDMIFDNYLQTLWVLSLASPLEYIEGHPYDQNGDCGFRWFKLSNQSSGQANEFDLGAKDTSRRKLGLETPSGAMGDFPFKVIVDGVQLFRPILYKNLPKTTHAVTTPLMFIGQDDQKFSKKPEQLSGGPLKFEAYLFWSPRIIPNQHKGVTIRVGNASGSLFDKTFMGYQVSEQTRLRQITAEIFVLEGLEEAINIDRESFNYAHPHYQYLVKWLHSSIRQLANRHKEIGKEIRGSKLKTYSSRVREKITERVNESLTERGADDMPEVVLVAKKDKDQIKQLRSQGKIALRRETVLPKSTAKSTTGEVERRKMVEKKAVAIAQLLHGWGLLKDLTYEEQEKLLGDIMAVLLVDAD